MMKMSGRTLWAPIVVLTLLTLCPLRAAAQQTFYSVSSFDDQLRIIDATTGATVSSVMITLAGQTVGWANGLAKHPLTGQLFAVLSLLPNCGSGPCARELVTIDPNTGVATDIGNTGDAFAGLAFNAAGTLYGVTGDGAILLAPETLYTLDTGNAAPTFVRTLGNGDAGETIAFNPNDGLIYHASGLNSKVFENINPNTLSVTNVPLSGFVYQEGVALTFWQSQGVFLMIDTPGFPPSLMRVTANGIVSFVANVDHFSKGLAPTGPGSKTFNVDCSQIFLQDAINAAQPGDTILVSGFCAENVLVRNDKVRLFLDGGGTAVIDGLDLSKPAIDVRGKAISIQRFTIIEGSSGIEVQRGANAFIDSNTIDGTDGHGVVVSQTAFAVLTNNTIRNNAEDGLVVKENSAARVGFNNNTDNVASGNLIQNNSGNGMTVSGSSSARAVGNNINGNGGSGVAVMGASQADLSANPINNNGGDGIFVTENSSAQLGEDPGLFIGANLGGNNIRSGIACNFGGALDGLIGTLTGNMGQTNIDPSCQNSLSP
jgi:hypothetical protein